jgi:hypothetical protein
MMNRYAAAFFYDVAPWSGIVDYRTAYGAVNAMCRQQNINSGVVWSVEQIGPDGRFRASRYNPESGRSEEYPGRVVLVHGQDATVPAFGDLAPDHVFAWRQDAVADLRRRAAGGDPAVRISKSSGEPLLDGQPLPWCSLAEWSAATARP